MQLIRRAFAALALLAALLVAASAAPADDGAGDLGAVATSTGMLSRMMAIKTLAGLDGAGADAGKLTLFAPSDAAFEALPADFRKRLLAPENRRYLIDLLQHHAVLGEYPTERLLNASAKHYGVDAADGTEIEFTLRREIDVQGAKIMVPNLKASNGILHIIDKVLIPRSVMKALEAPAVPQLTAQVRE